MLLLALWELARGSFRGVRELEALLATLLQGLEGRRVWVLALLSGFGEELFFRGAMQPSLGLLLTTLLFAVLHVQPGWGLGVWSLFAFAAGLVLGTLTLWTGSLLAAASAHALVNGVNLGRLASAPGAGRRDRPEDAGDAGGDEIDTSRPGT